MNRPSKKLQQQWEKKLKDSGFKEIETPSGELKSFSTSLFINRPRRNRQGSVGYQTDAKSEYFQQATHAVVSFNFKSAKDWCIWSMHARGLYLSEIAHLLPVSKASVGRIVVRLRREILRL